VCFNDIRDREYFGKKDIESELLIFFVENIEMASNPYAPYSSRNELCKAADDARDKYLKLVSYGKSKIRTDLGSIPTKAEVEKAKEEKERLLKQYYSSFPRVEPPKDGYRIRSDDGAISWDHGESWWRGGKKRRSSTTRRMRMKKTKRTQRTRRR
jgi:hypothetical protein